MRRREFIKLGGGTTAWPLAAHAQPSASLLRVGVASVLPRSSPFYAAFEARMAELGLIALLRGAAA